VEDTLFDQTPEESPLAQQMRPSEISEVIGQKHFLNDRFQKLIASDGWGGLFFWGPPGTVKTTLASVIARMTKRPFDMLSAVTSGVKDIKEVLERSKNDTRIGRQAHILFIDEVHRLNKAQQDVLLPFLEEGSIRFIGATTENPSFEINNAIASRSVIFRFNALTPEELMEVLKKAAARLGREVEPAVLDRISNASLGDARRALTLLEHLGLSRPPGEKLTEKDFEELTHAQSLYYDKKSEAHYDTISAFIKSVRASRPDAAVYYLARMIEAGEDPVFIARRLVILAAEDIGNANPMGLVHANAALQAAHAVGMPEARIILAQATLYLACSEKSNRAYRAIEEALGEVRKSGNLDIPMAIRNAPTKMMKEWGYGKGYEYPHDKAGARTEVEYLPERIKGKRFYEPSPYGAEARFADFLKRHRDGGEKEPT
jgi:putative ATPase